jgi:hypothetical protein
MDADERRKLIEQYLATRRRIGDIERKALKKVGADPEQAVACSFCGKSQGQVPMLIQGAGMRSSARTASSRSKGCWTKVKSDGGAF